MRFETLYQNFLVMTEAEQAQFFSQYYSKRTEDLERQVIAKVTTQKERGKGRTDKKITLTREQFELLQKLGLV